MVGTAQYWRPQSLAEAFSLLESPTAAVIGGGTSFNARAGGDAGEVVDLQALGLDMIARRADGTLAIGATTRLQEIVDSDEVPPVVREAARRQAPSTLRAQATIGGCVAGGEFDSELLAALLAYGAHVEVSRRDGKSEIALEVLFARLPLEHGEVITSVSLDTRGTAHLARTARTSADRAIVAAVARNLDGERRLALAGVAATPVVVEPQSIERLTPPGDFRGSSAYRLHLAAVLSARALAAVAR
jgi:CO/xanthine dehydrogenase FAD-binding subunit